MNWNIESRISSNCINSVQFPSLLTFLDSPVARALEIFIRDKYERKRYIAREWVPPKQPTRQEAAPPDDRSREKRKVTKTTKSSAIQISNVSVGTPVDLSVSNKVDYRNVGQQVTEKNRRLKSGQISVCPFIEKYNHAISGGPAQMLQRAVCQ